MKVKAIRSPDNPTFKAFLRLAKAKDIKKQGLALLSGPKQVREVIEEFPQQCAGFIYSEKHKLDLQGLETLRCYMLKQNLFRQLDLYNTGEPFLIVRAGPFHPFDYSSWPLGCTLCIPFQDPANMGAVIRSAAAFGVTRIVILKEAVHPFHPKSARVAGSSLFRVPVFQGPSLNDLDPPDVPLITLSPEGKNINEQEFPPAFCLVPGLEGPGLPVHLRNKTALSIPMEPGVESLNAALATGIVLFLWRRSVMGK